MDLDKAKWLAESCEVGDEVDPRLLHTLQWLVADLEKARAEISELCDNLASSEMAADLMETQLENALARIAELGVQGVDKLEAALAAIDITDLVGKELGIKWYNLPSSTAQSLTRKIAAILARL